VDVSVGGTTRGVCDRYVHKLLSQDTSGIAPALCRAVKVWAKGKHITDTKRGGLSNFAIVLLSTFFLQQPLHESPPLLPLYEHIVTMNTEWNEEIWKGPCPLQLGRLVRVKGDRIVGLLSPFFEWASKGMPYANGTKSKYWPLINVSAPLFVPTPGLSSEVNAACCLRADVWKRSVLPELKTAANLSKLIFQNKNEEVRATYLMHELFEGIDWSVKSRNEEANHHTHNQNDSVKTGKQKTGKQKLPRKEVQDNSDILNNVLKWDQTTEDIPRKKRKRANVKLCPTTEESPPRRKHKRRTVKPTQTTADTSSRKEKKCKRAIAEACQDALPRKKRRRALDELCSPQATPAIVRTVARWENLRASLACT